MKQTENYENKKMSFEELSAILDRHQRILSRQAIRKQDKAKKTLTLREKYQRYAQLGYPLKYKDVYLVYQNSMGVLIKANGTAIWNATIGDFLAELKFAYNIVPDWAM